MNYLTISVALYFLLLCGVYHFINQKDSTHKKDTAELVMYGAVVVIITAVKLFFSQEFYGHVNDMSLFTAWADLGRNEHVREFYGATGAKYYVDYPPIYLYVLTIVGRLAKMCNIAYGTDGYILLVKLFPILADTLTAFIVYRIAKKEFTNRQSMVLSVLFLLNPAYILNSVFWGQIDGLYTLIIFGFLYAIYKKKYIRAIAAFAIGMLTKPQMLIFLPLLGFYFLHDVMMQWKEEKKYTVLIHGLAGVGISLLLTFICAFPIFGTDIGRFIALYTKAAGQYPYASLNAANVFGAFGLNWADQNLTFLGITYASWGYIGIILTSAAVGIGVWCSQDRKSVFHLGGFTVLSIYMLAHTMHERYTFPLILILFVMYLTTKDKRLFFGFSVISILHTLLAGIVLLDNVGSATMSDGSFIAYSWAFVAFYVYMVITWFKICILGETKKASEWEKKIVCPEPSGKKERITRADARIMLILTVVYGISAFANLGSLSSPESGWYPTKQNDSVILDFGEEQDFHRVNFFLGWIDRRDSDSEVERVLKVSFGGNVGTEASPAPVFGDETRVVVESVFDWKGFFTKHVGRYIKIEVDEGDFYLQEMACYDKDQNLITPKSVLSGNDTAKGLFDEQDTALYEYTWYDGTYFDEVYHPRTAYEYMNGLWPYENTHPPLGKLIIGVGTLIFGMNPFGWRFFGTLCGVLMVPILYLLAKQLLKETKWAAAACILFTFDFMHLSQTRIATIDSFTAFFVMLMYYFMYQFTQQNFYETGVKKTLKPLFLSGLFFGIGAATKWQGIYAGTGLCVMYFWTLWKRFAEYRAAKEGRLVGDSETVLKTFVPNTVKTILAAVVCFVIIPFAIYFASYLPIILSDSADISYFWGNQKTMLSYHSKLTEKHPYGSSWWSWPLDIKPLYAYNPNRDFVSKEYAQGISSFGNPFVWWLTIPAIGYLIYLAFKKKSNREVFTILAGFAAMYLPWVLIPRQAYIYHFFPCVAFVTLAAVYGAREWVKKYPKLKRICLAYLAVVVLMYALFYPVLTGIRIPEWYAECLTWLPSWVLG